MWHPETYLRSRDAIEAAMAKALQDASSETRRNARDAYGAYVQHCPEQAAAFYKRMDRDLQDKMDDATRAYIMGAPWAACLHHQRQPAHFVACRRSPCCFRLAVH